MIYGYQGTIHHTNKVNVEIGPDGKVCGVWFRCMTLPFDQTEVDEARAEDMNKLYKGRTDSYIHAIDITDSPEDQDR